MRSIANGLAACALLCAATACGPSGGDTADSLPAHVEHAGEEHVTPGDAYEAIVARIAARGPAGADAAAAAGRPAMLVYAASW